MVQRFLCGANNMIRVLRTGNLIRNSKLSRIMREDLLKCRECTIVFFEITLKRKILGLCLEGIQY